MRPAKKVLKIVLGLLVVVGLVAAGWWLYDKNTGQSNESGDSSQKTSKSTTVSDQNIVSMLSDKKEFSTLTSTLESTGLKTTLEGTGPYTIFAPTDSAFEALPEGVLDMLTQPANSEALTDILKYHIVEGSLFSDQLTNGQKIKTVQGSEVIVEIKDDNIYLVDAKGGKSLIVQTDLKASNGVVHVINIVLLPQ